MFAVDWADDAAEDAELAREATSFKAPWTFVDVIGATGVLVILEAGWVWLELAASVIPYPDRVVGLEVSEAKVWVWVSGDGENPSAPVTSPLVSVTAPVRVLKLDTPAAENPATRFSSFPIAARMVSESTTAPVSEVFRPVSTVPRTLALVK